jgi:hypothetical protein
MALRVTLPKHHTHSVNPRPPPRNCTRAGGLQRPGNIDESTWRKEDVPATVERGHRMWKIGWLRPQSYGLFAHRASSRLKAAADGVDRGTRLPPCAQPQRSMEWPKREDGERPLSRDDEALPRTPRPSVTKPERGSNLLRPGNVASLALHRIAREMLESCLWNR